MRGCQSSGKQGLFCALEILRPPFKCGISAACLLRIQSRRLQMTVEALTIAEAKNNPHSSGDVGETDK